MLYILVFIEIKSGPPARAGDVQPSCKAKAKAKCKAKAKAKAGAAPGVAEALPKSADEMKAEMSQNLNFPICIYRFNFVCLPILDWKHRAKSICMRLWTEEGVVQCDECVLGTSPEPRPSYQFGGVQDPF